MKRDFTISSLNILLDTLRSSGYTFQTYAEFVKNPAVKAVVLRHDIDKKSKNALQVAKLLNKKSIKGTFYFRVVPGSWDESVIKSINGMGHEVGLHYEDIDIVRKKTGKNSNDLIANAFKSFQSNLEKLRKIAPVETICSHGSPLSPYDNKMIWDKYSYRSLGIIAEPYLDTDYSTVGYMTDTGRCWNGEKYSIRDRVKKSGNDIPNVRSTFQFVEAIKSNKTPDKLIINFHPQRWNNNYMLWLHELISQNFKNKIKFFLAKKIISG